MKVRLPWHERLWDVVTYALMLALALGGLFVLPFVIPSWLAVLWCIVLLGTLAYSVLRRR